jgi:hypothetical protein
VKSFQLIRDRGEVRLLFLAKNEFASRHGTVPGGMLAPDAQFCDGKRWKSPAAELNA